MTYPSEAVNATPARAVGITWVADNDAKKAVSECGCYTITWSRAPDGLFFNAWFGESPRKHLTGSFDKEIAKTVCEQHRRKHQLEEAA